MSLKVGVVGLSPMGVRHLEAVLDKGEEVFAICDVNEERLKTAGDDHNIPEDRRFTNWRDLLTVEGLEAVIICTPDQQHREMAEAFLDNNYHVMCEKPLALTREDIVALVKASKKTNKKFMVGQLCHFTPAFIKAKELCDAGTIGELYYVESEYAHDYEHMFRENDETYWRCDPKRHGVVGGGCHAVDLLCWFAGYPEEVFAYGAHKLLPMVPYDDATISVLKFKNGVCGKVFISTGCKRPYTMRTLIYGTKGTIICDNRSGIVTLYTVGEDGIEIKEESISVEITDHNAKGEFVGFAETIEKDAKEYMDATLGARAIEVCLAIVESSETGKPVQPNYNFE